MRALVTGAAGFIGSHVCDRLLADGHAVTGIDVFLDYYPRADKEANLAGARTHDAFTFHEADLRTHDLGALLDGIDVVFHQAAQAGVRASWGQDFAIYTENNIRATQQLLEAAAQYSRPPRVVYASSSSVYGDVRKFPMEETDRPQPMSPYGVSKLAAEHLCALYHKNFGVPTVSLRYFTVYGPRQRPDMAFRRFMDAISHGRALPRYGTGEQTRDFTFITDIVDANLQAAEYGTPGGVYNLGGGSRVALNDVIALLGEVMGTEPRIEQLGMQHGDVMHTYADTTRARAELGFEPQVELRDGLAREWAWVQERAEGAA